MIVTVHKFKMHLDGDSWCWRRGIMMDIMMLRLMVHVIMFHWDRTTVDDWYHGGCQRVWLMMDNMCFCWMWMMNNGSRSGVMVRHGRWMWMMDNCWGVMTNLGMMFHMFYHCFGQRSG